MRNRPYTGISKTRVSLAGGETGHKFYAKWKKEDGTEQPLGYHWTQAEAQAAIDSYRQHGIIPPKKKSGPPKKEKK